MKGNSFYYVTSSKPRQWIPLGDDIWVAKRKWAEIESRNSPTPVVKSALFKHVVNKYRAEVMIHKAIRTQRDNENELKRLLPVFENMPLDSIKPTHVRKYLDKRGLQAKVRANREKALLSHIFNFARDDGITSAPNPCIGVKAHTESGRDKYVSDDELNKVWNCAEPIIQDCLDLAYFTGQRPADVRKIKRADIFNGFLHVKQNKTHEKLRIVVTGDLKAVIDRIFSRSVEQVGEYLIQHSDGRMLTYESFRYWFDKARQAAGVDFQYRDLRAKSATDVDDIAKAQKLLGHKSITTTEIYLRKRVGDKAIPVSRSDLDDSALAD
ncbi:tyrosine-type recombinase/integrase [Chitinimonas sp. PSY-7]|uniref:tyrosine-type recombinase/integrase n=1 Tax=Chitinimonas sp. PSY-7 TaxID=3459088 RepID=UPI00403FDDA2